jgi:diguanylate cyclase (GGDEF)-like protein
MPVMPSSIDTLAAAVGRLVADVYVSHDGLAERAAALAGAADTAGERRWGDVARLVAAELDNRGGRAPEGVACARRILGASDDRLVRAHAHAVIAGGLWRIGDNATAVRHALWSNRMLVPGDPLALRADHAIILAVQVNDQRLGELSVQEFVAAQDLAEASGLTALIVANLNNWAWCTYLTGDIPGSLAMVERMRACSEESGEPLNASAADTVARILLESGDPAGAAKAIQDAIDGCAATDSDAVPAALITLAEIQRREGRFGAALDSLGRCRILAAESDLPDVDVEALFMIAGCLADAGDYRAAYETMVVHHEAWTSRRSQQSEAAARFAHAQFAVDEAYRDSERYREMAERDPLTGLANRRRSDAELASALGAGEEVCVALLDLDHFKRINDSFSHAVGDDVLRAVADLLRGAPAHAGRQGGEEFILVLKGGLAEAVRVCEALRRAIEAYAWQNVAAGLHVTTSVGVTAVRPGEDASTAVGRADSLLYLAKNSGRNRVESS